jgi:hypothetical protein
MIQKNRNNILMTVFVVVNSMLLSQADQRNYLVTVNQDRSTIKAEIYNGDKRPEAEVEKQYAWYAYRKILLTSGGYEGKLLNGSYSEFYLNDQLLAKGKFKMGLKTKEWRYWYPDGTLKEIITWNRGVKHGSYALYNDYGKIVAKGRFKHNKLHAKFYTYSLEGKVISRKRYRNGNEVLEKMKAEYDSEIEKRPSKRNKTEKKQKSKWFKQLFKRKIEEIPQATNPDKGPRLS